MNRSTTVPKASFRRSLPVLVALILAASAVFAEPAAGQAPGDGPDRSEAELRWAPTPVTMRSCGSVDCEPVGWLRAGDSIRVWNLQDGWWTVLDAQGSARGHVAAAVVSRERPSITRSPGEAWAGGRPPVEGEGFVVSPWYFLRDRGRFWVRGLARNVGEDPAAALLQATVLGADGEVITTEEFWVGSPDNVPPGETRPIFRALTEDIAARRVRLRILGRRTW